MTARVLRDAQDVTTVETTTKPIEVWLSRPHVEVTCRIVFPDGTAIAVGVDALSLRSAQREVTAWLIEQGYEPTGCWSAQNETDRQAARSFRSQDQRPALPGPPPGTPPQPRPPSPDPGPAPGQGWLPAARTRRAAPKGRADRGSASSAQAMEQELRAWALANAQRDDVIRAAAAAGVSPQRIHEVTRIARTTIMRILGSAPRPAPRRPS
jgi:hypothetical protein